MIELKFKDGSTVDVKYPIKFKDGSTVDVKYPIKLKDSNGNVVYFENEIGYWHKHEYDEDNNLIFGEDSHGYWVRREYDENGTETYYENSNGKITCTSKHDVVEMTMEEVCKAIGKNVKVIK